MPENLPNVPVQPSHDPNAPAQPIYGAPQQVVVPQQATTAQGTPVQIVPVPVTVPPTQGQGEEVHTEPVRHQLREEIRLYSHSPLAYWWPVWLVGFIIAAISQFAGQE